MEMDGGEEVEEGVVEEESGFGVTEMCEGVKDEDGCTGQEKEKK